MRILVTGGAGYIGSHMVKMLTEDGHDVLVVDNLSNGHRDAVPSEILCESDILDRSELETILHEHATEAVFHFAGRIEVGQSVRDPGLYYRDNVCGSRSLIDAMGAAEVRQLVFSSTAAVYGEPENVPINEDHPKLPGNPYGASKWMVERMLADESSAHGLRSVSLRYFNAAGAARDGSLGERHEPETHLIPLACQVANRRREHLTIFGRDYPTPDGTCIRDFIHVEDLCSAHLRALNYLAAGENTQAFNLGYGRGVSVQEIIDAVTRVSGQNVRVKESARRAGDPSRLMADPDRVQRVLEWQPEFDDLDVIVGDAWRWEKKIGNQ